MTGQRIDKILSSAVDVYAQYAKRLSTSALNAIVARAVERKTPPVAGLRRVKLYFSTQTSAKPPSFVLMTNSPDDVHFSYRRYLANRIREEGGFELTPIRLNFRKPSGRRTGQDRTLESK
jgi:GTP-binding protein